MEKGTTSTPHDAVFKQFLRQADTARDFLDIHLPPALRQLCDLDSLTLESGSFIEENLRAYYSDVLWALKTAAGEGYIYVVIEHQSSPDAYMAYCSIIASPRLIPGRYPGSTSLLTLLWLSSFIPCRFRWWILPSCLMTKLSSIEESPYWS